MASNWSGVFGIVDDPRRHSDKFVTVRCIDSRFKDEDSVYFTAKASHKVADVLEKARKGSQVFLSGEILQEEYKGKNYLGMWVSSMNFVNGGKKKETSEKPPKKGDETGKFDVDSDGEDIPF